MLPFPRLVQYGNTNAGSVYLGMLSETDLSYNSIVSTLSPSGTLIQKQTNFRSYVFVRNGMKVILPSQPVAIASYKEVYEKGMVWGTSDNGPDIFDPSSGVQLTLQNASTTIQGEVYKIRLLKGSLSNTVSLLSDNPDYKNPMTEWELFVYSIWNNLPASYTRGYNINSTDRIPKINYDTTNSTRRWVLVQGSDGSRTSPRSIGRGRFDSIVNNDTNFSQICSTSIAPLWTAAQNMWWPVFEKA